MKLSRGKIILILILMSISISILVYSFAYTTTNHYGDESNYIMVSEISFGLIDAVESISLNEQTPTIDKFGLSNESFGFSITNTMGTEQQYTLRLVDKENVSTISNEEIRYQLTRNGVAEEIKNLPGSGIIDSGVILKGETYEYSIVVWLSYDASTSGGTWDKAIRVEAGNVNIDTSGANDPILLDNMIPVYYDEDDSVWKKADKTNSNVNYRWYDYDDRVWANAVTIYSTAETDYFNATEGTEILMDDITMFYVWIPRFKYDLFGRDSTNQINVTFEKGIESTGTMKCTFKDGIEDCSGEEISYTHPAFTFDGEELTGYWINKFELSPEIGTNCYNNPTNANCNNNDYNIVSLPNMKSLQRINLSNLFKIIRKIELNDNIHGFTSGTVLNDDGTISNDLNNFDVHLSKNFETAALTYLAYSQYGKYSNILYDSIDKNVFASNTLDRTGSSFVNDITYDYNVPIYGTGASTTGNVYGVYDLNGGAEEAVMANSLNQDGSFNLQSAKSYFNSPPNAKYYDSYMYSSYGNYDSFYGDAIDEFIGFSNTTSAKPRSSYPFIVRKTLYTNTTSNGVTGERGGRAVITIEQDIYITKW